MLLADAIEAWGRANRSEMSREELEELGTLWRTIKTSAHAELDFRAMGKEDARAVMALFDAPRRAEVSRTLNQVRKWALAQPSPEPVGPVTPGHTDLPGSETVVMRAPTTPTPVAPPPSPSGGSSGLDAGGPVAGPPGFSAESSPPAAAALPTAGADPLSHGPVQGWQPPETAAAQPSNQNGKIIAVVVAAIVVLALVWFVFVRGDDDAQPIATTDGSVAGVDTTPGDGDQTTNDGGSGEEGAVTGAGSGDGAATFDGGGSGDFCTAARRLEQSDPFGDTAIDSFGPEFFAQAVSLFEGVQAIAPSEIQGDIGVMVAQFRQLDTLAAEYDYNFFDPQLGEALSALDTTATDAASDRLDAYLMQVCAIDTGATDGSSTAPGAGTEAVPGFDDLDLSAEQIRQINEVFLAQFDVSPDLAECLSSELGDLTAATTDPSILNEPVCGTTLFDVISGLAG